MTNEPKPKLIIGWREYVDLPDWDLHGIRAKADTGARSSAMDVSHLEVLPGNRVRFEVVARRGEHEERRLIEAEIVRRTRVKSSFGDTRERLFVATTLWVAGQKLRAEVGLVNRENMLTSMLLGRRTLEDHFLVDPGHCYLHGRRRRRTKDKKEPQGS